MGENDGDRTRDTQGHNLVLYRLSYILRRSPCLPESRPLCNRLPPRADGAGGHFWARRPAMIFTNDFERISSTVRPVARASASVTAPHAIPRRK